MKEQLTKALGIAAITEALLEPGTPQRKTVRHGMQMGGKWWKKRQARTKMQKKSRKVNRRSC
jgi:hypothetical protein